MIFDYKPITITDVTDALDRLQEIERPDADNEFDPINAPAVYDHLSEEDQQTVMTTLNITKQYIEENGNRGITELNIRGYRTSFGPDQYEPDKNVGSVTVGEWKLDISDESQSSHYYN